MQFRFHGNATRDEAARATVQRKALDLDRHFAKMPEDLRFLDVHLHHHAKTDSYRARLVFHAPDRQLAADGHGITLDAAIQRAFDDLEDEVEEYLARTRAEPSVRREQRAQRAAEEAAQSRLAPEA